MVAATRLPAAARATFVRQEARQPQGESAAEYVARRSAKGHGGVGLLLRLLPHIVGERLRPLDGRGGGGGGGGGGAAAAPGSDDVEKKKKRDRARRSLARPSRRLDSGTTSARLDDDDDVSNNAHGRARARARA